MGLVSPRPPTYFEHDITFAEIRDNELWCAITENPSDIEDWFVFDLRGLNNVDPHDVVRHPENYKVVGQYHAWAELKKKGGG